MTGRILAVVALWLAIAAFSGACLISAFDIPKYSAIKDNGRVVPGTITRLEPQNHNLVEYTYTIGERQYVGQTLGSHVTGQLFVGKQIAVNYLPDAPAVSVVDDPARHIATETVGIIGATLFAATLLTVVITIGAVKLGQAGSAAQSS